MFASLGLFLSVAAVFSLGFVGMSSAMEWEFKKAHSLEERLEIAASILGEYWDRLPVIVEKSPRSNQPDIDKNLYRLNSGLTVGEFIYVIKRRLRLPDATTVRFYFSTDNIIPGVSSTMMGVYQELHDEDNFLYVYYYVPV